MTEKKKKEEVVEEVHETMTGATIDQSNLEGKIRISEDVIAQLATKALNSVEVIVQFLMQLFMFVHRLCDGIQGINKRCVKSCLLRRVRHVLTVNKPL